jgi:TonB family protein
MTSPKTLRPKALGLTLALSVVAACATQDGGRYEHQGTGVHSAEEPGYNPHAVEEGPAAMKLESELGVLETADVERTLEGELEDVRACYGRAGKAQEYAGGRVVLRFLVGGDGHVHDVWVVESSLGNYAVERCVVAVGRHVVFTAPSGQRATTFDYPIEFRSTSEVEVLAVDGLKVDHDVAALLPQLAPCGRLARETVSAIVYVEPSGFPGSVGLAAEAALDESVGHCVVQTIRRWKMSTALPGRVTRVSFSIPGALAEREAGASEGAAGDSVSARHAVSSASSRHRRR